VPVVRVLVGSLPRVLCDVIKQLLDGQSDIALVAQTTGDGDLLAAAREARPDVIILGLTDPELPPIGEALLWQAPAVRILAVIADDGRGFLYELRPQRAALGELSAEGLVEAIRAVGGALTRY